MSRETLLQKVKDELQTLEAIDAVRKELHDAIINDDFFARESAKQRLLSLYESLNVTNVIVAVDRFVSSPTGKKVA